MKAISSKLILIAISALFGLLVYRSAAQLGETIIGIHERHPGMGLGGWLAFVLWFAGGVFLTVGADRQWGDKKIFLQGDVPFALMLVYMSVSGWIYFVLYMRPDV